MEEKNQRMTAQRRRILDYLRSVKTHPSAEVVFEAVSEEMPNITLATVYRNLNLLSENGEILRLVSNGDARFDGDMTNHQHFYCKACEGVFDFFCEEKPEAALKEIEMKGFSVDEIHIIFRGKCKNCKEVLKN